MRRLEYFTNMKLIFLRLKICTEGNASYFLRKRPGDSLSTDDSLKRTIYNDIGSIY